jgi:hypothetical protein
MFTSKKKKLFSGPESDGGAIVVSFFGGDAYYARCAERLARQCEQFEISHDICEVGISESDNWINICRKKIEFYTRKSDEYDAPVIWLDIDAQIIADPRHLLRSNADVGAFLRNFKYLVGFDPMQYARLLHPGYLLLGRSDRARAFIETLREVDATADPVATDDFVLQEALIRHAGRLSFEIFSPSDIVFSNEARERGTAVFQHGDSGNVKLNIGTAVQHQADVLTLERRKRVFLEAAEAHLKAKRPRDAEPLLRELRRMDPEDDSVTVKLLRIYHALGWDKKFSGLLAKAATKPNHARAALRFQYEGFAARIEEEGNDSDKAFARSRQYRLSFDEEARRREIADAERVPLWWWERPYPGNLGDMINPYVIEGLTGVPPKYQARGERVLAIGSIIKFAKKGDQVWGAGCPSADHAIEPGAKYHAVRGPLTRQMVLEAGGECEPVYGDPAWVLPLLHGAEKPAKTHRLGLIRHFTHRDRPMELGEGVREIEIIRAGKAGIEAFLDEMLGCEAIISSSLHGVIIANAYGIPARLATFLDGDRQIHGDGMKFDDYFLSIGLRDIRPLDLGVIPRIEAKMASLCQDNPAREIDLEALLNSAPFTVLPEVHEALRRRKARAAAPWNRLGAFTRRALGGGGR